MDRLGSYSYRDANLYQGLKRSVEREVRESIRRIPLGHMIREFMVAGTTSNNYLIPAKLADVLYRAAQPQDVAPLISAYMVNGWPGGDLTVPIPDRYSLKARRSGSGGDRAPRTPTTTLATLSPVQFSAPLVSTVEMIEDAQIDLVEWHTQQAAYAIAAQSNDLVLTVLASATDGVGTVNASATGDADETKYTGGATSDVLRAWSALGDDEWVGDTLVCTPEAWEHSISQSTTASTMDGVAPVQIDDRFDMKLSSINLDVLFSTARPLHAAIATDARGAAMTNCISVVFDRTAALCTGRKRWMLIEDYANPIRDLEGAVVSCRQDSVTLYNDAIYRLTET
jgi:hypothetical protein